jgi:hypothetical protein
MHLRMLVRQLHTTWPARCCSCMATGPPQHPEGQDVHMCAPCHRHSGTQAGHNEWALRAAGGAILGDKTRMLRLGALQQAYVRPSPARGTLGECM